MVRPAADPALPTDGDVDLLACVHCGFCLPACPTYRALAEENDSPRGRLYLMRAEEEGRLARDGAFAAHISRCLGCLACETACPAGVPFRALLERAQDKVARSLARRISESTLLLLLTGRWGALTYGLLRAIRDSGAASTLSALPGRAGLAAGLLAATRPAARLVPIGREAPPRAPGAGPGTYALLAGCVMQGLFEHVHGAVRRVLTRRGLIERGFYGQACCGALHAHAGRPAEARKLARRNIDAFERAGAEWLVADSAGCGAALRAYPEWLKESPEWAARAAALAERVRDVSEILVDRAICGPAAPTVPSPAARTGASVGVRVAYDAPCHLWHGQGVREEPLEMLRGTRVLTVEALPSSQACCGGAGVYNLFHPGLADEVLQPKLEEIRRGDYDWVATGNPGCIMQIGAGARRDGIPVPVVHPVELLDAVESRAECTTT